MSGRSDSNLLNNYSLLDLFPKIGFNYYKLQQSDLDGKLTDLGIRSVSFQFGASKVNVYPNPATVLVNVKFTAASFRQAPLIDLSGKILQHQPIKDNQELVSFNLSGYATGSYFVKLTGSKESMTRKFVKF